MSVKALIYSFIHLRARNEKKESKLKMELK